MTSQRPDQELDTRRETDDEPRPAGEALDEDVPQMPAVPPAIVPPGASPNILAAAGMGLAGFAEQDPEAGPPGDDDAAEPQADER